MITEPFPDILWVFDDNASLSLFVVKKILDLNMLFHFH